MPKKRPIILLDTNMLLLMADGLNIFGQIEDKLETHPIYIVLKPVIEELEKLAKKPQPSVSRKAKFALEIARKYCQIIDVKTNPGEKVDDIILRYASEHRVAVATNDKELRKRLRAHSIPEIYLREEGMIIEVEGLDYWNS
ncbi:MAG: 30S processome protein Utp24 [Staphylothermus sp.]|nr:30S processome protein Utp24 [Staphylothermus sp.]